MSVACILDSTYSTILNSRLNPILEIGTSISAPVYYVNEIIPLSTDDILIDGNLDVKEHGLKNVKTLTVVGNPGTSGQLLGLDSLLNLHWTNPSITTNTNQWSISPAMSDVALGVYNLSANILTSTDVYTDNLFFPKNGNNSSIVISSSSNTGTIPTVKCDTLDTVLQETASIYVVKNLDLSTHSILFGDSSLRVVSEEMTSNVMFKAPELYATSIISTGGDIFNMGNIARLCVNVETDTHVFGVNKNNNQIYSETQSNMTGFGSIACNKLITEFKLPQDYFVSLNGDILNGTGSIENPFGSVQQAINVCEALTIEDNLYRYIHITAGDYSNSNIIIRKKIFILGEGVGADACTFGCRLGVINIAIDANGENMSDNQIVISGLLFKKLVNELSTNNHIVNIKNSFICTSAEGIIMNNLCTASKLWVSGTTVMSEAETASTLPLIDIWTGECKFTNSLFNATGNQDVVKFGNNCTVDSIDGCQFISDSNINFMNPIINITSNTQAVFTFKNCSFVYSSETDKSTNPSTCAIYTETASYVKKIIILYCYFSLGGTTSVNYVINYNLTQPVIYYFSNSASIGNAFAINAVHGISKFSLSAVA